MSTDTHGLARRAFDVEQALTTAGVIVSGSAMLCLLVVALGGVQVAGMLFFRLWVGTMAFASFLSPWVFRCIRRLFRH
jgi:hypothetical protein